MTEKEMKERTKANVICIDKLCSLLLYSAVKRIYIAQLIRCLSSVVANYRAACRSKSKKDFIFKLQIVEEEGTKQCFL